MTIEEGKAEPVASDDITVRLDNLAQSLKGEYPPHTLMDLAEAASLITTLRATTSKMEVVRSPLPSAPAAVGVSETQIDAALKAYADSLPEQLRAPALRAPEMRAVMKRAVEAALLPVPSPVEGGGWQDIATAPKDGTIVDLYGARGNDPRRFPDAAWREIHVMGTGDPTGEYRWFFPYWDMYGEFKFTHWHPIPTPPAIPYHPTGGGEE